MRSAPPVMFLGLCERASHVRDGYVDLAKWNLLGLKSVVVAYVYPLSLHGFSFVMGIYAPAADETLEVVLRDPAGGQVSSVGANPALNPAGLRPAG